MVDKDIVNVAKNFASSKQLNSNHIYDFKSSYEGFLYGYRFLDDNSNMSKVFLYGILTGIIIGGILLMLIIKTN